MALPRSERPRLGISACLLGERVRHDGAHKRVAWLVDVLGPLVEWVGVCPEVELGLGTPRPPMQLERGMAEGRRRPRLVVIERGEDLTEEMERFAAARVASLGGEALAGYVLKSSSPSCGDARVKIFTRGRPEPARSGRGLFAAALRRGLPMLPLIEETSLAEAEARGRFVSRVAARARRQGYDPAPLLRLLRAER